MLKHIWLKEKKDETMCVRVFNGLEFQGSGANNWGMDIKMPAWLEEAHNTRSGRIFMCGTGPSLIEQLPRLKELKNESTWTVNRAKMWKELPFTPTHHSIAEPGPIIAWGNIIHQNYDFPEAVNRIAVSWWSVQAPGWLWCPKAPDDIQMRWEGFFGLGATLPPLPSGWASPLTCAQLAAWLGYTEIYFLGIDTTQVGQAWDKEKGRTAEPRNIRSILECFERAGRDMKRAGRVMRDCTPGGLVNREGALEYLTLEEALHD